MNNNTLIYHLTKYHHNDMSLKKLKIRGCLKTNYNYRLRHRTIHYFDTISRSRFKIYYDINERMSDYDDEREPDQFWFYRSIRYMMSKLRSYKVKKLKF